MPTDDAKPLTAEEERALRQWACTLPPQGAAEGVTISTRRLFALLDAERAKVAALEAWKAGATAAATISFPPRTNGHTESVYLTHRARYEAEMGGPSPYCEGADVVAAALNFLRDQLAAERAKVAALEQEQALIDADTQRGITDCSTPLFQRVRNMREGIERLEAAHAETKRRLAEAMRAWGAATERADAALRERDAAIRERDEARLRLAAFETDANAPYVAGKAFMRGQLEPRLDAEKARADAAEARVRTLLAEHEQASQIIQGWEANATALAEALRHVARCRGDEELCGHLRRVEEVLSSPDVSSLLALREAERAVVVAATDVGFDPTPANMQRLTHAVGRLAEAERTERRRTTAAQGGHP